MTEGLRDEDDKDGGTSQEANGLARRISVAGLQVSQAADELQQAAERLMAAEGLAREAEMRWRTSDEQIAQGAVKNAELLGLVESARTGKTEAEERARRAEQRLQIMLERTKAMEEQLSDLEARWQEAEATPRLTLIVEEERDELKESVAAEVRRPLTSILGLTLALKHADPSSGEGKTMVRQLATNARRLDRYIGQLLDLDKIANGSYIPNRRRTDLEALARRVVEEASELASRDLRVEADHVAIEIDPGLTEQMLETLLTNAGRRTAAGSPVWIKISSDPEGAVIAVDDTGPEIPTGLRGPKFAAMSDEGPAARRKKPRGATGLALLARLAELHGGRAWVEERPGGGASFRVFLPHAPQEPNQEAPNLRVAALAQHDEEDGDLFDPAAVGAAELRELSSFDDLSDELAR
jgi:signal transduction histidine kinase